MYTVNDQNRLQSTEKQEGAANTWSVSAALDPNLDTLIERFTYDDSGNVLARLPELLADSSGSGSGNSGANPIFMNPFSDAQANIDGLTPSLYVYNDKNQLIEARGAENVFNTFNAEGYRASKTTDSATTYYTYEYDKVIKESYSSSGEAYNVYGLSLISREVAGQKVYYLYNSHGDVTGLLSSSGAVIASYYYDAFGNIVEQSGNFSNPYRYSGYIFDKESRLYNLNAHFYDASIARFMQEDTFLGNRNYPLSLNLYTYCVNNPLIYHDPTGHSTSSSQQRDKIQAACNAYLDGKITRKELDRIAQQNNGIAPLVPTRSSTSSSSSSSSKSSGNSNVIDSLTTLGLLESASNGLTETLSSRIRSMDYVLDLVQILIMAALEENEAFIDHITDYINVQNHKKTSEVVKDIDPTAKIILNTSNVLEAFDILTKMEMLTNDNLLLGEAGYVKVMTSSDIITGKKTYDMVIGYPVIIETRNDEGSKPDGTKLIRTLTDANHRTIIQPTNDRWTTNRDDFDNSITKNGIVGVGTDAYVYIDFGALPIALEIESYRFFDTLKSF